MTSQERASAIPGEMTVAQLEAKIGQSVGVSPWILVDQARIDRFADVTGDHQFIHVDPVATKAKTPFGGTIAHGFLTLSLLSEMGVSTMAKLAERTMGLNYGFDKIRFLSPVRAGSRIRGTFKLAEVKWRTERELMIRYDVSVEIEGNEKPALAAEWLTMTVF